ncbi:uncharacterized protein LTR77_002716 [Saxophila tyrrhenica]|uniref:Peptidase M43 pregnancy-associated plasma-A domain-containing protein n=1 Tax=Saxophila tyrrhenica TaxID=1690608 RepID=A0AAV9PFF7_9PEZI|nr:hypothetical protein LTR77_002716 [Saxophila tyrrhenica]
MKCLSVLAAIAALTSFASAAHFVTTNGTHFKDDKTGNAYKHFGCDVHRGHASSHFNDTVKKLHKDKSHKLHKHPIALTRSARGSKRQATGQTTAPIAINAYFHIISTAAQAASVTQDMATQQMAVLNAAYNPYGISFTLAGTDFTTNDAWSVAGTAEDLNALKAALRNGTYKDLNIYFHTDLAGGNLGTCTLPSQVPAGAAPSVYVSDGCNVNAATMPGGTMGGYNQGKTAVHETGHWMGLLHTFEGYSCEGDGDMIDDTPQESQPTDGCPDKPPKDSCPSATGVDPIHNYMDYSTDACYEGFTPLQVVRMENLWNQFRVGQ